MAESIGAMYLRLGLNLSELETGFVTASQTVAANISRLNRESQLIRIRSQVEIEGLDEVADAERIAQIRIDALNQRLAIQRDRVRILSTELQSATAAHGANSVAVQRATIRFEQERLALARLEGELRNFTRTQENSTEAQESSRGFGDLSAILEKMPPQLKAVAAGIGAVGTGAGTAAVSVNELLEDFRELQNQAYELNMSVGKTRDFLRTLRLGGGDIGDLEGYIRGITDAFVKGEVDDPEFIALSKYGAKITDATGRLKEFKDIVDEVYQAFKKADAAGEAIEFLQLTGGESGVRDAIQFFRRYEEAVADANKVIKANVDDSQLHELDRAMNLVAEQASELKNALGDIFVPAAQTAAENFFGVLRTGTEILKENKDAIQSLGFIAAETFETVGEKIKSAFSFGSEKIAKVNEMLKGIHTDNLDNMSWRYGGADKKPFGVDAMIKGQTDTAKKSFGVLDGIVDRAKKNQAEYNAEIAKTTELWQNVVKTIKGGDKNPLSQYAVQRIQNFKDELEELRIELDFDDEFEKAKAQVNLWLERELDRKLFVSDDEKNILKELHSAKLAQIERDEKAALEETLRHADEYWRNAADIQYSLTHSAFEKEMRDIELWKDAQKEKADTAEEIAGIIAESAAKEADAFEREVDRIKGKMQTLEDKIFEIDHSQYENDLRKIQQEYLQAALEYQQQGVLPLFQDKLKYLYLRQKQELDKKAAQGGEYTKSPTNDGLQRGGNGIVVIGGDQIIDDGLIRGRQEEIGLLVDENKIRAQVLANMAESEKKLSAVQQSLSLANLPQQSPLPAIELPMPQSLPPQLIQPQETTVSFETIVTPLNNIASVVGNILDTLSNRTPRPINISPNIHNELGGAYVFDERMKKSLVDDITNDVVTSITDAVQQATRQFGVYNYGA